MGPEVIYPERSTSQPGEGHRFYPHLREGLAITGRDQVWCSDITQPSPNAPRLANNLEDRSA